LYFKIPSYTFFLFIYLIIKSVGIEKRDNFNDIVDFRNWKKEEKYTNDFIELISF